MVRIGVEVVVNRFKVRSDLCIRGIFCKCVVYGGCIIVVCLIGGYNNDKNCN